MHLLHYIPILSTILATTFAVALFLRYKERGGLHYFWWGIGFLTFAAGTFAESWNTLLGWSDINFRYWYIVGAFLGGYPLAQGSIYLLMNKKFGHWSAGIVCTYIVIASVFVCLAPVDKSLVGTFVIEGKTYYRLSGDAFVGDWSKVRLFSPLINLYALLFLVGGAIYSAWLFRKNVHLRGRYVGNILIAIGGLLPGIGGSMARAGVVEVLYVTEFLGIVLIYGGYRACLTVRTDAAKKQLEREQKEAEESKDDSLATA